MRVLLLRPVAPTHSIRYSGGVHGLHCVAKTLAAAGHDVHLLYCATKSEVMYAAMLHGALSAVGFSRACDGVATWAEGRMTHHVSLLDVEQSMQDELSHALAGLACSSSSRGDHMALSLPRHLQRLVTEAAALVAANSMPQQTWVILDADGSQQPAGSSLLEACSATLNPQQLLLLVQNIHFLPVGPHGSAPRSQKLLQAWHQLGGIVCVSDFVAAYVAQQVASLGLQPHQLHVAHYATWGAFGTGPFPDFGPPAAQRLAAWRAAVASRDAQQEQALRPVIGCLKLTPEKGGQLFLSLAQHMPQLNFLGVCADPELLQQAAGLPNVRLVSPVEEVRLLLQHMTLLIMPSCWQEAYGMAATDAVLHGLPVLVSNQGGLQEAALGHAAGVVPVAPMVLPIDPASGCPSWAHRQLPTEQPVQRWVDAIQQLLGSQEAYEQHSRAGREAAMQLLDRQPQLLQQFEAWLQQLAAA